MLQPYVDYTLLRPDATHDDFAVLCREADQYPDIVRAVCVLPDSILCHEFIAGLIKSSSIKICAVNDFPLGRGGFKGKLDQALGLALYRPGFTKVAEIDTVLNAGAMKEGQWSAVFEELKFIRLFPSLAVKVILETGHQWYDEFKIKKACELAAKAGAFCVKTSTGFVANIPVEKKVEHVRWMHEAVPELMIKLAGGVKNSNQLKPFYDIVPQEKLIVGASSKFWLE